jgi:hypothetical protein
MSQLPPRYQGAAGLARYWYLSHVPLHKGVGGKGVEILGDQSASLSMEGTVSSG